MSGNRSTVSPISAYSLPMPLSTNPPAGSSQRGMTAIGVFLLFGATMACLAGTTLVRPGTVLDRMWALNPVLLALYGASLNLAPVEFAEATGIYLACLFIAFQLVNYLFFRHTPSPAVLLCGTLILVGAAIIYIWK